MLGVMLGWRTSAAPASAVRPRRGSTGSCERNGYARVSGGELARPSSSLRASSFVRYRSAVSLLGLRWIGFIIAAIGAAFFTLSFVWAYEIDSSGAVTVDRLIGAAGVGIGSAFGWAGFDEVGLHNGGWIRLGRTLILVASSVVVGVVVGLFVGIFL